MVGPESGWAVDESGLLRYWDGVNWLPVATPAHFEFYSVTMLSGPDGWIV